MTSPEEIESPVSVRCAEWTVDHEIDPIGSAGRYDTIVLVETPAPWPRDATTLPGFADAVAARPYTQVLAVGVGVEGVEGAGDRDRDDVLVTVYRRRSLSRLRGTDHLVERERLAVELARIVADDARDGAGSPAPPDAVICGHGRRDRCCGRLGVRLETVARERSSELRVRRCSHLGGHRFAPTAMTLRDGRMWAHLDESTLDLLDGRTPEGAELTRHYRGSTALDPWAQAAEREVMTRLGSRWSGCELEDVRSSAVGDGRWNVDLGWRQLDGGRADATITVVAGRTTPTPVCGQPIDAAVKSSREYTVGR